MKKYIVFAYEHYDAFGGMNDIKGDYTTLAQAKKSIETTWDNVDIVDRDTWEIVWDNSKEEKWKDVTKEFVEGGSENEG